MLREYSHRRYCIKIIPVDTALHAYWRAWDDLVKVTRIAVYPDDRGHVNALVPASHWCFAGHGFDNWFAGVCAQNLEVCIACYPLGATKPSYEGIVHLRIHRSRPDPLVLNSKKYNFVFFS